MLTMNTTGFTPEELQALETAWAARRSRLTLDSYCSVLFDILKWDLPSAGEIRDSLLDAATTATSPRDIRVPVWTYLTRHWTQPRSGDVDAELEDAQTIRQYGWHWTVGTDHSDGFATWQGLRQKPVDYIVKKTDILDRIAAQYGPTFTCIRSTLPIATAERFTVVKTTIWLTYCPRGRCPPPTRPPYLLKDDELGILYRGEPLRTPPPSPRTEEPPPLKRPCYRKTDS